MIPTLLGVLTITFIVMQFVPGGPVEQIMAEARAGQGGDTSGYKAGRDLDKKQVEELKKLYGFDKPAHVRYFEMLAGFARFDLGKSFLQNKEVWQLIKEKLPVSMSLGPVDLLHQLPDQHSAGRGQGGARGVALRRRHHLRRAAGLCHSGFRARHPAHRAVRRRQLLRRLPAARADQRQLGGAVRLGKLKDYFWHLTLPLICLVITSFAVVTLLTKNTFVEEIRKQYVLVARAKGLSQRRVLYKHIFRNALIPLVTGFPAAFIGAFFTGALLIETLFSLDGLGLLSYESVVRRDYPVVLGSLYLFTLIALVVKLVSDLLYMVVDPRVQFGSVGR